MKCYAFEPDPGKCIREPKTSLGQIAKGIDLKVESRTDGDEVFLWVRKT